MAQRLFAKRTDGLQVSGIRKMVELAPQGAINFGLGEPDFPPPPHVVDALYEAAKSGKNGYGPTMGLMELREGVAESLRKYRDDVEAKNVLITCGATQGLIITAQTLYDHGDEVLIPDPGFVLYGPHAKLTGAKALSYHLRQDFDFRPDIEEMKDLISPRTKAIVVNSPNNPTGGVLAAEDVKAISDMARDYNLVIVTDEVYNCFVFDGPHQSLLAVQDLLVYANSFSKIYSMTGWRIGYIVTSSEIMSEMYKIQYYTIACPPTPIQWAALAGLKGPQKLVEERRLEYKARRDIIVKELNSIDGFRCVAPKGAFYTFPSFDFDMSSQELAMRILKAGVICTPGTAFGPSGEGHLRFSFANSRENIKKGMEIVAGAVKGLKRKN